MLTAYVDDPVYKTHIHWLGTCKYCLYTVNTILTVIILSPTATVPSSAATLPGKIEVI